MKYNYLNVFNNKKLESKNRSILSSNEALEYVKLWKFKDLGEIEKTLFVKCGDTKSL
jgi:hypothetical protein